MSRHLINTKAVTGVRDSLAALTGIALAAVRGQRHGQPLLRHGRVVRGMAGVALCSFSLLWELLMGVSFGWALVHVGLVAILAGAWASSRGEPSVRGVLLWVPLLSALTLGLVALNIVLYGLDIKRWDALLLTGVIALFAGMWMTQWVPRIALLAVRRLLDSKIMELSEDRAERFERDLVWRAARLSNTWGLVTGGVLLGSWLLFLSQSALDVYKDNDWAVLIGAIGGVVAGERIGMMIAYGSLWRLLRAAGAQIRVVPGHIDGAGGLKPFGDLYFYQSLVAGIPALFLVIWWWFIPLWPIYAVWRSVYVALLPVAILCQALVFFLPMRALHAEMRAGKAALAPVADRLYAAIGRLQLHSVISEEAAERRKAREELAELVERYQSLRSMPTWPIDASIRRWFSLSNAALLLPFGQLLFQAIKNLLS